MKILRTKEILKWFLGKIYFICSFFISKHRISRCFRELKNPKASL